MFKKIQKIHVIIKICEHTLYILSRFSFVNIYYDHRYVELGWVKKPDSLKLFNSINQKHGLMIKPREGEDWPTCQLSKYHTSMTMYSAPMIFQHQTKENYSNQHFNIVHVSTTRGIYEYELLWIFFLFFWMVTLVDFLASISSLSLIWIDPLPNFRNWHLIKCHPVPSNRLSKQNRTPTLIKR